jgi:hypothetical protein
MRRPSLFIVALSLATLLAGESSQMKLPDTKVTLPPFLPDIPTPVPLPELPPVTYKIWTVPGYGVLNGTEEASVYTNRTFYGFRSVFYADMPIPETRFLVSYFFFLNIWYKEFVQKLAIYVIKM